MFEYLQNFTQDELNIFIDYINNKNIDVLKILNISIQIKIIDDVDICYDYGLEPFEIYKYYEFVNQTKNYENILCNMDEFKKYLFGYDLQHGGFTKYVNDFLNLQITQELRDEIDNDLKIGTNNRHTFENNIREKMKDPEIRKYYSNKKKLCCDDAQIKYLEKKKK